VEPQEIDIQLEELDNRLDRLRALYEQYFMGIEKIEPQVARKDVDRRFWVLRRTQIRNTARRFRLQVLVQRYNTFQQYWGRICREIENGTYIRHLLKAQKLGAEPKTIAARKRFRNAQRAEEGDPAGPGGTDAEDLEALLESGADLGAEAERAAMEALESAGRAELARAPSAPFRRHEEELEPLDLDLEDDLPSPPPAPAAPVRPAPRHESVGGPASARGAPGPSMARTPSGAPGTRPAPIPSTAPGSPPSSRFASAPQPSPGGPPSLRSPLAPQASVPPVGPPSMRSTTAASLPPRGPVSTRSPTPQASLPPRPGVASMAPAARPSTGLTEERVRQLHSELVATRKKLNQPDGVSLDGLSKSLRDTEAKLLAQHGGRSVEFQVVVKDGKPIVKPVVRK